MTNLLVTLVFPAYVVWLILTYGAAAYLLRLVRLAAYAQEWIFRRSFDDDYVPERVRRRAPCY